MTPVAGVRRIGIDLTLLEDVVLSARPATAGGHEGLDHVPGQALLGACAARLYPELEPEEAWIVFHSGRVRFGNGLPVADDGAVGWPMPLALHGPKTETVVRDGRLEASRVRSFAHPASGRTLPGGAQPRQLREGYLTLDGRVLEPARTLRMKTAVDPATGSAREAHLFGYEALAAGQRFHAVVEADEDVPEGLLERVRAALTGELLLGRSRSAEYGLVEARPAEARVPPPAEAPAGRSLLLWLLSDLALLDAQGQPTLEPLPERLGLGAGRVDWDRSFVRARAYAPWNGHRGAYGLEREVLCQGSVIRLELDAPPSAEALARLERGCGLWREAGLGRVWAAPPLLEGERPAFVDAAAGGQAPRPAPVADGAAGRDEPLVAWLRAWRGRTAGDAAAERLARALAARLEGCYRRARRDAGAGPQERIGPSPSQWGAFLSVAKAAPAGEPGERLFGTDDQERARQEEGVPCPAHAEGWGDRFFDGKAMVSFREWLRRELREGWRELGGERARCYRLAAEVARRGREVARRLHRGEAHERDA